MICLHGQCCDRSDNLSRALTHLLIQDGNIYIHQWIPTVGNFVPPQNVGNAGRHFWLFQVGEVLLTSGGSDQERC